VRVLWLTAGIVLVDQFTKLLVKGVDLPGLGVSFPGLPYGSSRPIVGDLLRLTYIENAGMAFGFNPGGKLFFSLFTLAAAGAILLFLYHARTERLLFRISLALVLGGAVGNLIDRIFYERLFHDGPLFYGRVVDFLDMDFPDISLFGYALTRWPVFNVADACVTVGVLLMLFTHRRSVPAPAGETPADGPLPPADDRAA